MSIQINRNDEILVLEAIVKERPRPE
jgi:hypothetical protein